MTLSETETFTHKLLGHLPTEVLKARERIYLGDFVRKTGQNAVVEKTEMKNATHVACESVESGADVKCFRFTLKEDDMK